MGTWERCNEKWLWHLLLGRLCSAIEGPELFASDKGPCRLHIGFTILARFLAQLKTEQFIYIVNPVFLPEYNSVFLFSLRLCINPYLLFIYSCTYFLCFVFDKPRASWSLKWEVLWHRNVNRHKRPVNPFTPESDQCQISPAASLEILQHTVWRIWFFIAYSAERWLYFQFSLVHFPLKVWENVYFLRTMQWLKLLVHGWCGTFRHQLAPKCPQKCARWLIRQWTFCRSYRIPKWQKWGRGR